MTTSTLPQIVIVGAGFGGLRAARRFSRLPVQVTLIDRHNYHLFQPLLYQVATAGVSAGEIAYPIRAVLRRQRNARFLLAEVTDVDLSNRRLITSAGEVPYDVLILAMGGQTSFFGNASLARHAFTLKTLQDAERIRDHVLRIFEHASRESDVEKRRAMLTFAVAGGGPTGVEMAGALSELIHGVLRRDFPGFDLSMARVILLEAADRLLPAMPEALGQATLQALHARGVEVWLNAPVEGYDGAHVRLKDGREIPTRTLIWVTGIRAAGLAERIPAPRMPNGRIRVEPTLQVSGYPEVFVLGDAAYLEDERGAPLPMVAPVALQQADWTVANVQRLLEGKPLLPFRYRDPGMMATIGRNQAVAHLGGLNLRGFFAWLMWVVVHIFQLIGFRNRLAVMLNWAWDYFLYDRALRLIEQPEERPEERQLPV